MRSRADNTLTVVWTIVIRILGIGGLLWLAWEIRSVLTTIVLAVMLAYLLLPAVEYLCSLRPFRRGNKRITRLIATLLVFIVFFVFVGLTTDLFLSTFKSEASQFMGLVFPHGQPVWDTIGDLSSKVKAAGDKLEQNLPPDWASFLERQKRNIGSASAGFASSFFQKTFAWLGNAVEMILIPVLAFYFLLDSRSLKREIMGLVPPWRIRDVLRMMRETGRILQSYVVGQLILCLIAGLVTGLVLHLAGVRFALILAVFAGVTRAIPILGPVVSGVPICIVGWSQGGVHTGLWLLGFVILMHFAESKFIMPILIGDRMKLHPAVILISLLIGAELFGLLGMFIAAPVAAVVRDLLNVYVVRTRKQKENKPKEGPEATAST